jgi:uncharacterized membrane protein
VASLTPHQTSETTMRQQAEFFTLALWWGALTVVGFGVVPLLFANLETPQAAGRMAAVLFSALDWLGWACAVVLLLIWRSSQPPDPAIHAPAKHAQTATAMIAIAVCASLLSHWLVAPHIVARENLRLWHSLGSILYLLQWLCVTTLFAVHVRARRAPL